MSGLIRRVTFVRNFTHDTCDVNVSNLLAMFDALCDRINHSCGSFHTCRVKESVSKSQLCETAFHG